MENKFAFAKEIVREAASYIRKHMKDDLHIERKSSPTDLVTKLDKEVQTLLIDKIRLRYPNDLFCAEEGDFKSPVYQIKIHKSAVLDGLDEGEIEREVQRTGVNDVKGEYILVGSLKEVSNNGNWPTSYDAKIAKQ